MARSFRSLIVAILALWKGLSQKEIGAKAGISPKQISYHLGKGEDLEEKIYDRLLGGLRGRPAEVAVVTGSLEALDALEHNDGLTAEERDDVELGVLEITRRVRPILAEAVRRSRTAPPLDEYPQPAHREPARWLAGEQWALLKKLPEDKRPAALRAFREPWSWALMERVCDESIVQASRKVDGAASLAHLAQEIADGVQGPEGWRSRVRGYSMGHVANSSRVAGRLNASEAAFAEAWPLWEAGSDPDGVLDPGRLLDLEASLRRDQRRFEEALDLLDRARVVSRCPGKILINKGFTLEVMGEYERALKTLREAEALLDRKADPRLWYKQRANLAVIACHTGRYAEAAACVEEARQVAIELGDELDLLRLTWLDGRIAAGRGQHREALSLLKQARREFAARNMGYDVALALLEEAALLLDQGGTAEVKILAKDLASVFASEGVHREALAALRLFQEAAEREEATAELARSVLRFLFRARYDQGLQFEL